MSDWRPISDPPSETCFCLVANADDEYDVALWVNRLGGFKYFKGADWFDVLYWMAIPDTPKPPSTAEGA